MKIAIFNSYVSLPEGIMNHDNHDIFACHGFKICFEILIDPEKLVPLLFKQPPIVYEKIAGPMPWNWKSLPRHSHFALFDHLAWCRAAPFKVPETTFAHRLRKHWPFQCSFFSMPDFLMKWCSVTGNEYEIYEWYNDTWIPLNILRITWPSPNPEANLTVEWHWPYHPHAGDCRHPSWNPATWAA